MTVAATGTHDAIAHIEAGSTLAVCPGQQIAVVGAGLAGLVCARTLVDRGFKVTVFDKGRVPGGRICSRKDASGRVFDHGAQFFTARGEWLVRQVESWQRDGVVARWSPGIQREAGPVTRPEEPWWVGAPEMGALASHLAAGLDLHVARPVTAIQRTAEQWAVSVADDPARGPFDALVLALPAAQAVALLAPVSELSSRIAAVAQTPCWAVMLGLRGGESPPADVFENCTDPIAWAAREGSKPGRQLPAGEQLWVLHASTMWSQDHLEDSAELVAAALASRFIDRCCFGAIAVYQRAHRWRFARGRADSTLHGALVDAPLRLVVCGDWSVAARIEGALQSGRAAADQIFSG